MDETKVILIMKHRTYMTVKNMAEWYGTSAQTIRKNIEQMKKTKRYNPKYLVLDEDGKWLVNSLMYEDYLANKAAINAGIKKLAPYDPEEVSRQRGEYKEAI
ncbi:MAG: hypothetical protein J6D53_09345 [Blautia sp.]|nr:hypothetical protein [Blautia sp.]